MPDHHRCYQGFKETIPSLLSKRGLTTIEIETALKGRFPECIDDEECAHGGRSYGAEWKHLVRGALDALSDEGIIGREHDGRGKPWYLAT